MLTGDFGDAFQAGHGQQHDDALVSAHPERTLADKEAGDTDVFLTCEKEKKKKKKVRDEFAAASSQITHHQWIFFMGNTL